MTTAYMSQWEIQTLAEEALTSFEMTASWQSAANAAIEFAADEWEIKATAAQVATALNIAKTGWQGIAMSVKKVVYAPQH
jgi:hypothetical protein|tara:strand:+ start:45 stop:284 length:240 start_codon:yes stop_codon:yes gene_type:complete